jgi:hypothetical protein
VRQEDVDTDYLFGSFLQRFGGFELPGVGAQNYSMRPVAFGETLPAGTRLTLFSDDKPDRFFTVIKFCMDATSGVALTLKTGVPSYPSRRRGRQNPFTDSSGN